MPELPEVETTRRGIAPYIEKQIVDAIIIRQKQLRWPIPDEINPQLSGQSIDAIKRRGKYILLQTANGTAILHLGMSGSLRIVEPGLPPAKHDHVDICFSNNKVLRFTDPRRFGSLLWTQSDPYQHKLLSKLGPEPLTDDFTTNHLLLRSRGRSIAVKSFIMDSHIVVGVGNIYACESLFRAGIHPERAAGKISKARFDKLVVAIKAVLSEAIIQGGTTLKDFQQSDGKPGYFKQALAVYGRAEEPCLECGNAITVKTINGRSTFYCARCQR